jgi:hypothetical protein
MSVGLLLAIAGLAGVAFLGAWTVAGLQDRRMSARPPSRPAQSADLAPPPMPADRLVAHLEGARGIRAEGRGLRTPPPPRGAPRLFVPTWARRGVEVKAARARTERAGQSREGSDSS